MWNESFQGMRRNENSPKMCRVEQRVRPVLCSPNMGRNASSHSVMSCSTYQTVPLTGYSSLLLFQAKLYIVY
ncbi:hypothetical protein DVH24_023442 [Malus domestica]|uniref:Uncharacterized protein n=1 Tax=Malus domestica TaxID=3750 RepID=A0A498HZZ2_MALDO|nr:hypothetical protein DVH24_023442 [Malus domestica]